MSIATGGQSRIEFDISEADTIANVAQEFIAPSDGFIKDVDVIVNKAVTTGGTVRVNNYRTGSSVQVAGLVTTIANGATKGTAGTRVSATKGAPSRYVKKGDRLSLTLTGFATAGALNGAINIEGHDAGGQSLGANGSGSGTA